jgi:hypothetical protein
MSEESSERSEFNDRSLGLHRDIDRRDFLNGVGVGIGSLLTPQLAMPSRAKPFPNNRRIITRPRSPECAAAIQAPSRWRIICATGSRPISPAQSRRARLTIWS